MHSEFSFRTGKTIIINMHSCLQAVGSAGTGICNSFQQSQLYQVFFCITFWDALSTLGVKYIDDKHCLNVMNLDDLLNHCT